MKYVDQEFHILRIIFQNSEEGYKQDEVMMQDQRTIGTPPGNVLILSRHFMSITTRDQAERLARGLLMCPQLFDLYPGWQAYYQDSPWRRRAVGP